MGLRQYGMVLWLFVCAVTLNGCMVTPSQSPTRGTLNTVGTIVQTTVIAHSMQQYQNYVAQDTAAGVAAGAGVGALYGAATASIFTTAMGGVLTTFIPGIGPAIVLEGVAMGAGAGALAGHHAGVQQQYFDHGDKLVRYTVISYQGHYRIRILAYQLAQYALPPGMRVAVYQLYSQKAQRMTYYVKPIANTHGGY